MRRNFGKKVALLFSMLCGTGCLAVLVLFIEMMKKDTYQSSITGSAFASMVFLGSCAYVLYSMSLPQKPLESLESVEESATH